MALFASLLVPSNASGHAAFLGADPEPGVRLEDAPQRVVLNFTEPLNDRLSRVKLVGPDGKEISLSAHEASAERLMLRPRVELPSGAYEVRWHTVSTQDGHALEGTFSFGVRAAATAGGHQLEQSPLARAGWVRVAFRALLYVSVLMLAAAVLLPLLVRHGGRSWVTPPALAADGGTSAPTPWQVVSGDSPAIWRGSPSPRPSAPP